MAAQTKVMMSRLFALLVACALGAALSTAVRAQAAAATELAPDHPERYTVVPGDTLWDISARFLAKPWLWPEIWYVNPQIANPHLIYPGDVISLVYVDGQPRLMLERGTAGVERLSPQIRVEDLAGAIPTIPVDAIRQFLTRTGVLTQAQYEAAPYIVQSADEHLITAAGDRVFVRRMADAERAQYRVVRLGTEYRDPVTEESLGHEAVFIADASMEQGGDPATMLLTRSNREALIGDRVLPQNEGQALTDLLPSAPKQDVQGHIIAVLDGVTQIGQYQVVALDRGAQDGLAPGHVLSVWQSGATIEDPVTDDYGDFVRLPDQQAGLLMVFRTFDRVSYGLIMRATRPIHVLDRVRNPT